MIVVSCAIQDATFDIRLMLGFGVVGYVFKKIGIPLAPLTLVLGNRAEDAFRLSMIGSSGFEAVLGLLAMLAAVGKEEPGGVGGQASHYDLTDLPLARLAHNIEPSARRLCPCARVKQRPDIGPAMSARWWLLPLPAVAARLFVCFPRSRSERLSGAPIGREHPGVP